MLNEVRIKENRVCTLQGHMDELIDILKEMVIDDRQTLQREELEARLYQAQGVYRHAWNEWADIAHIGGSRYVIQDSEEGR